MVLDVVFLGSLKASTEADYSCTNSLILESRFGYVCWVGACFGAVDGETFVKLIVLHTIKYLQIEHVLHRGVVVVGCWHHFCGRW